MKRGLLLCAVDANENEASLNADDMERLKEKMATAANDMVWVDFILFNYRMATRLLIGNGFSLVV